MKKYYKLTMLFLSFTAMVVAQTMQDFSVKDLDGNTINLYADTRGSMPCCVFQCHRLLEGVALSPVAK